MDSPTKVSPHSPWRAYSYAWITLGLFAFSLAGHWLFGWMDYTSEQAAHGEPVVVSNYTVQMFRETFENWQSEFLQLLWQVGGLAFFLFLGSPQSKEGTDRMEAKIDVLLLKLDPDEGKAIIDSLDESYSGRHTDRPGWHRGEPAP